MTIKVVHKTFFFLKIKKNMNTLLYPKDYPLIMVDKSVNRSFKYFFN